MNDTNTNTDIKCAKGSDDDKLRDLPDLEDIVRRVNNDDDDDEDIYKDMPGLREQDKDKDNENEEDYTYTNNKGIPGVTTRSGRVVKQAESIKMLITPILRVILETLLSQKVEMQTRSKY